MKAYSDYPEYQELKAKVRDTEKELKRLQKSLESFEDQPEYNRFDSLEEAEGFLEVKYLERAREACEGSYNMGKDHYIQIFYVRDQTYRFRIYIDYNRHDKTYYYVDGWDTEIEKIDD